jgi:hypothetical protein
MRTLSEILASLAILTNAVIYGTWPGVGPLGLSHHRARRAADPRPRRAMRRARRGLTASRRLSGWEPAALITTRHRPICQQEGTDEQPGS